MKRKVPTKFLFLLMTSTLTMIEMAQAFVLSPPSTTGHYIAKTRQTRHLNMMSIDELSGAASAVSSAPEFLLSFLDDDSTLFSKEPTSLLKYFQDEEGKLLSPDVEAEVLTDVSHVIMDFSSFLTPSRSLHRIYAVIGRILVICADYLPDHMVRPEELAIQLFLLGIAAREIYRVQQRLIRRRG